MFLKYYGLNEQPFGTTPDPRLLYLSASHREAFASLVYGIETGRGFMALIAKPGMGKTTLLFQLMEQLRNSTRTAFLFQTQGDRCEFFSNLIIDLGLDPAGRDLSELQRQLNEVLIRESQLGRRFVLVIDEAQNLDDSVLESVRMLSNFETSHAKLMQIVLAGQPQLGDKLARAEMVQLRQRVSIVSHLNPFSPDEVARYIDHRLKAAGYQGGPLLTREAMAILAEQSEGIPRNINNLCFHALSLGFAKKQKKIDLTIMGEVLADLNLEAFKSQSCEEPKERLTLDDVTLGRQARVINGKGAADAAPHSQPTARRHIRKQPKTDTTHWLLWTVALLTLILLGEAFLDSVPFKSQQDVIGQSFSEAVYEAKNVVANHDPLKLITAQDSHPEPHQNASGITNQTVAPSQNMGSSQPAPSLNSDSEGSNAAALDQDQDAAPGQNIETTPETFKAPVPAKQPEIGDQESTSKSMFSSGASDGKLVVESNISGGTITVNGRTEPGWITPHILSLPPGSYQISVSKGGYTTWSRSIRVPQKRKRWIVANLGLPRGVIMIDTEPQGMQVFIDGKPYGPSEVEAALTVGPHTYKVVPPSGEEPFTGTFVLKPGDILTRKVRWLTNAGKPDLGDGTHRSEGENKTMSGTRRKTS